MDLLEYQVKEWFGKMGIPVLPSQRIDHPTDLKRLKIRYPIVLKSQVHADERAKAGGVRIVETTIDAIAAAQNIFNLPIWGELPEVLLAESKYDAKEELYLAVVLDTALCRPVLLGCKEPDIDWESPGDKMQYVVVEQEFSPFYARRLGLKMGLQGALMQSVSDIVEKMYQLFVQKDLDLIEINPLAVSASGQIMALNGKIRVNERAIKRHPEIVQMAAKLVSHHRGSKINSIVGDWDGLEIHGKIGILGNGTGSVLTTLDAVANAGGKPGISLNLRHSFLTDTSLTNFCDRLETGLKILAADNSMKVILINFLGTIPQVSQMPEVIANFIQLDPKELQSPLSNGSKIKPRSLPRLVVRLAGSDFENARQYLATLRPETQMLIVVENLDEAVLQAVRLAKLPAHKKQ
ncbi:succinate--CoA ligase subunit beta [Anabaena cylindrica FACHB-243]|uniref:Succinyl-CoA synthetase (ADP-forming) beta subunit n=1 Tax=Anabaena cylindrica (strain ATCC 27899 / PCC 7122) TaxID=272123 RepID=K9ZDE7_ANACC|nr:MULTISPECIES: succinate--CoA ligase subunit beta [Anabaena]AFZ56405.1 succinyl-CoA synthetase (ADP-forming) beta subunit [Anabaena cylindrica PCC 7122]MBD2418144.1 succinate--CoA ligase subunit beta [Anabaena cylindrica FACHB-243]MBY5281989.1 succinate--CoA ligase subunit beta [Anabaena sp. CCAP 1446/1C]MBY5309261.1 succinate--CoA ligase subunit beta [Anabaena sp. CCAP 1446/1C]MCM2409133.1 succinate--CoA ligase subunit beta [Anabaena sp. CCAP 1446/1C]